MTDALEFSVVVPGGKISAANTAILNMQLTNVGKETLLVNSRFAVAPEIGDVWLTIRKGEQDIPFPFRVRLQPLGPGDFVSLEPKQIVVGACNLTKRYKLHEPGTYEIFATYVSSMVPPQLEREPVFKGKLEAAPTKLILI